MHAAEEKGSVVHLLQQIESLCPFVTGLFFEGDGGFPERVKNEEVVIYVIRVLIEIKSHDPKATAVVLGHAA